MKFSDKLLVVIREHKKHFRIDVTNRAGVIENLKFLHDCCAASEELLLEAALLSGIGDNYFGRHLNEESGELSILENDLKAAGVERWTASPIAMAMIGTQYYLIKHVSPVALLGYMAVQEADPTPIGVVEDLETAHGKDLFKFLRMHALKDLEHRKELIEVIDQQKDSDLDLIAFSARNTLEYLAIAMRGIYG